MELLSNMSWPGAIAVLGSVGTVVFGILGYLMRLKKQEKGDAAQTDVQQTSDIEKLHTRVSEIKDRVADLDGSVKERLASHDGDVKELRSYIKSLQKQITDHEHRDIEDFKVIQQKLDKLMEIIIQILQDDGV